VRIVAVTPLYPPQSRVGAWLATHEFLRHALGRGHQVHVFSALSDERGYTIDGITVDTGGIRGRMHAVNLARDADVVVSHCGDGRLGSQIAAEVGRPSVRMVHSRFTGDELAGAALAVFNSTSLEAATSHSCSSVVCRPPVDPADYATTPGDLVTLVNLSEPKGGRVMWRIAERMPMTGFLGVRGDYGHQVIPRCPNVETIQTTPKMRDAVYARTRVLLMPSQSESWGRTGVEAMASGIPVIAHPTGGLIESLGTAGIFVDRDDIDGWVAEIERLKDPDEWAAASELASQRSAQLDPAVDLDLFVDHLEKLAG
jgi:hypothetical protein